MLSSLALFANESVSLAVGDKTCACIIGWATANAFSVLQLRNSMLPLRYAVELPVFFVRKYFKYESAHQLGGRVFRTHQQEGLQLRTCKATVRPGTHYAHVTWAHMMLRVQLGCERRFTIEFYGADSHFCHSAYVTWSDMPARLSHFCCRTHFVRRDDVAYVSSSLQTLSVVCRKTYCFCRRIHWNR